MEFRNALHHRSFVCEKTYIPRSLYLYISIDCRQQKYLETLYLQDNIMLRRAPPMTASVTLEVQAPAPILFETLTDLNASHFVPSIVSQTIVKHPTHHDAETNNNNNNNSRPRVGMVIREEKRYHHADAPPTTIYKTITGVTDLSVTAVVHQDLNSAGSDREKLRTGSWTIHPVDSGKSVVVWTFASSPDAKAFCSYLFCRKRILQRTTAHFRRELQAYADEAERRAKASSKAVEIHK